MKIISEKSENDNVSINSAEIRTWLNRVEVVEGVERYFMFKHALLYVVFVSGMFILDRKQ